MNNQTKYIGIITLICLLCLAFTTGDNKSQYSIPLAAWSVTAGDIDLDGDNDIIVGHKFASQSNWGGLSILENSGEGYFQFNDSLFVDNGFPYTNKAFFDDNVYLDFFSSHVTAYPYTVYIGIIYNYGITQFDSIVSYVLTPDSPVHYLSSGDINNDYLTDIVFASNNGKYWAVMYNDGNGNFSLPQYTYVSDYFPTALACGDINFDNRDDIVVCGQSTEVYFSYPGGFELMVLETNDYKEDVAIVDFDLDGDNDIITFVGIPVVNVSSLVMYENLGNNQFDTLPEFFFWQISSRIFVTDFNNDSLPDVLFQLSDKSGYIIYYNEGDFQLNNPQFVALPPSNPQEGWRNCYCEDMDGNGYKDIITVKTLYIYLPDNLEILFNDGNGNFLEDPLTNDQTSNSKLQTSNLTCYPNPFSDKLTIEVKSSTPVKSLKIFDLKGNLIKTLIDGNIAPVVNKLIWNGKGLNGKPACQWDGTDMAGREVQPGIYFVYLSLNNSMAQSYKIIKY